MLLYRVRIQTTPKSGTYLDATPSLALARKEAVFVQREHPTYVVFIDEEDWPGLSTIRYWLYRLSGRSEGFGTDFQRATGQRHTGLRTIWSSK